MPGSQAPAGPLVLEESGSSFYVYPELATSIMWQDSDATNQCQPLRGDWRWEGYKDWTWQGLVLLVLPLAAFVLLTAGHMNKGLSRLSNAAAWLGALAGLLSPLVLLLYL